MRRVDDHDACFLGLGHDYIHLGFASDVVSKGKLGGAARPQRHLGLMREILARPDGELQAMLQVKKRDGAMLKFTSDNASAWGILVHPDKT
jgi:hypothetical protein